MNQQNQSSQLNASQETQRNFQPEKVENKTVLPTWSTILIIALAVIIVGLAGFIIYQNIVSKPAEPTQPTEETIPSLSGEEPTEEVSMPKDKTIYFGMEWEGKYSFVNVNTGETKTIIPSGYELVSLHSYDPFPNFFILRKNDDLFSYSLINGSLNKIPVAPLEESEVAVVEPSISDKSKFYLEIFDIESIANPSPFEYDNIISSRKYFLDADNNQVQSADNINLPWVSYFSGCYKYDSKYSRFFIWPCGEGIGTTIPLSVYDLTNKTQRDVVTFQDFGLREHVALVNLSYNNGYFLATPISKDNSSKIISKIIIVNPTKDITKEVFIVSQGVLAKLNEINNPYSALFAKEKNTIVIGGADFILLFRFDSNNQIVDSSYIPEQDIYANFIFYHGGKIYYHPAASKSIRIINLDSWQLEKSISVPVEPERQKEQEITLILFE